MNFCYAKAEISYSTSTVDSLTWQPVDGIKMKAVLKRKIIDEGTEVISQ